MKMIRGSILPLKAIEEATLLKTFKLRGFYQKTDGFFGKKLDLSEIAKGCKFAVNCISYDNLS